MRIKQLTTIIAILFFTPFASFAGVNVFGAISSNTTWTFANSPYTVTANLTVNSGITLTVQSGVEVRFASGVSMTVNGSLNATTVVFTSDDAIPVNGSWGNLTFGNGSVGSSTISGSSITWGTNLTVGSNYTLNLTNTTVSKFSAIPLSVNTSGTANLNNTTLSNCDEPINVVGTASFSNNSLISNVGGTSSAITLAGGNLSLTNTNITGCNNPVDIFSVSSFTISGTTDLSVNTNPKININFSNLSATNFSLPSTNVPYIFPIGFTVSSGATLTINNNAILKFPNNYGLSVDGTLIANASVGQAIYFTSYKDDNWGGDSNEDAGTSAPNRNDWAGIKFNNSSVDANCLLRRAKIRFATNGIETDNAGPTIDSCDFSINNFGLSMLKASNPVVTNNTFGSSATTPIAMSFEANPTFTNNSFSFSDNEYDAIGLYGGTLTASGTLKIRSVTNIPNVTYVMLSTTTVPAGMTLTIDPGVVIKTISIYIGFQVYGTLIANGTAGSPIVFTSVKDDNYGNPFDTNKDGSLTSPAIGDFGAINILQGSTGTSITYCKIRYASGYNDYNNYEFSGAAINFVNTGGTVQNNEIKDVSDGVNCFLSSNPTIQNNQFTNLGVAVTLSAAANPTLIGNTLTNVSYTALGLVGVGINGTTALSVSGTIKQKNFAGYTNITYVLRNNLIVANGSNIDIDSGVVIKSLNYGFTIYGGLKVKGTASKPVLFTSSKDDNFGTPNDTNGDGNATSPNPGEGPGVYFGSSSDDAYCKLYYLNSYFGGAPYNYTSSLTGSIQIENASPAIDRVVLNNLSDNIEGIGIFGNSAPIISNTSFVNGSYFPVSMSLNSNPTFTNISLTSMGYSAILINDQNLASNATLVSRNFAGITNVGYALTRNLTINSGSQLTISPGVVIKMLYPYYSNQIIVRGSLKVNGTAANKVIFTDIRDDSAGGDSNNDGNTSTPAQSWYGITFAEESDDVNNNITYAQIRFTYQEAIRFINSGGLIDQVKINFGNAGLGVFGTANPNFQNIDLQNLDYPVRMDMFSNPTFGTIATANIRVLGLVIPAATYSQTATFPIRNFAGYTNITYVLEGDQTINGGTTITIPAGIVFKSPPANCRSQYAFFVKGRLNTTGTISSPVVFTKIEDDLYGNPADIENNGNATSPGIGGNCYGNQQAWLNFPDIADDNSSINFAIFRFAHLGVNCLSASPTFTNNTFSKCNYGFYLTGTSTPVVNANSFVDLAATPLLTSILTYPSSVLNNTISGTTWKGIGIIDETLSQDFTLPKRSFGGYNNIPYFFAGFTVGTTAVLTIAPGITTKWFYGTSLYIQNGLNAVGGLRADSNIVFTSWDDDYYGGDMNSDSTISNPTIDSWGGIQFQDVSIDPSCNLSNCFIRYASTGITTTNASPNIQKTGFFNCTDGVSANGSSKPKINYCDFYGITGYAVNNVNQSFLINAENNWWGSNTGPTHAGNPSGTGSNVTDKVDYLPFRTTGPNNPISGDVSQNGLVQAYDAALILQYLVSATTLTTTQQTVGDVSGNNSLSALDASYILQYSVGLINNFVSEAYNRPNDVNNASLSLSNRIANKGTTVNVALNISDVSSIFGNYIRVKFDTNYIKFDGLDFNNIGMNGAYNSPQPGIILISMAGANPLTRNALLANLRFKVKYNAPGGTIIPLVIEKYIGNEKELTTLAKNGSITIAGKPDPISITSENEIQLYPIPANKNLKVNIRNKALSQPLSISIVNTTGQKIRQILLPTMTRVGEAVQLNLNVMDLPTGVYYLSLNYPESVITRKFIISRQ